MSIDKKTSRIPPTLILTFLLISPSLEALLAATPPAPKFSEPSPAYILELLNDLDSRVYEKREKATGILKNGRLDVVRALVKVMKTPNHESSLRAYQILKVIYFRALEMSIDDQADEIEVQLRLLMKTGSPKTRARIVNLIEQVEGHFVPECVQKNAIHRLKQAGVRFNAFYLETNQQIQRVKTFENRNSNQEKHYDIIISQEWNGTKESIRFFRRLPMLKNFLSKSKVYVLPDANLTDEELISLRENLPNGVVENRGPAYMGVTRGVSLEDNRNSAIVQSVFVKSPAGRAGIKAGDQITKIGNSKINSFEDLIKFVAQSEPDQTVTVFLHRHTPVVEKLKSGKQRTRFRLIEYEYQVTFGRYRWSKAERW